jgi:hypothetical protein
MAPQLGVVTAAAAARLRPRIIATVASNPVEIQSKKGYHHGTFVLGGRWPPGLGAVGVGAPAAPVLPNKNGPCAKGPFNPKSARFLSTHSEIFYKLPDGIMWASTR